MRPRPPRSTLTDTLFPYTALFPSYPICPTASQKPDLPCDLHLPHRPPRPERLRQRPLIQIIELTSHRQAMRQLRQPHRITLEPLGKKIGRASGGKECVSTCRSRWSPDH